MADTRSKQAVLQLMQRMGMPADRIAEASRTLPDPVDLTRDGDQLAALGLTIDSLYSAMGAEF